MSKILRALAILLLILFLTPLATLQHITVHATLSRTLVVPDQYFTIQDAVNKASAGDTVFVKNGVYYNEAININKAINLVGENPDTTYLIGNGTTILINSFAINSPTDFSISNFTIENVVAGNGTGIYILGDYVDGKIANCDILNNSVGIQIQGLGYQQDPDEYADNHIQLSGNIIMGNTYAVNSADTYLEIYNNTMTRNYAGLGFWSDTVNVHSNIISYNRNPYNYNLIGIGVGLGFGPDCFNCSVENNVIQGNYIGVWLEGFPKDGSGVPSLTAIGKNNKVTENNFQNNAIQAKIDPPSQSIRTDVFSWDHNYWSDYNGKGSYVINENNIDHIH